MCLVSVGPSINCLSSDLHLQLEMMHLLLHSIARDADHLLGCGELPCLTERLPAWHQQTSAHLPAAPACASRTWCSARPRTPRCSQALWSSQRSHAAHRPPADAPGPGSLLTPAVRTPTANVPWAMQTCALEEVAVWTLSCHALPQGRQSEH